MRRGWMAIVAVLAILLAGPVAAASATAPVTLGADRVLDDAGVLSADEKAQAETTLRAFAADGHLDLWVVYVDTFTGPADSEKWATAVAKQNGLGPNQYLLAIAVKSRQFYLSGDSEGPISGDQLGAIEQDRIQPVLADDDWAGAVDAATAGLTDAMGGGGGGVTGPGAQPGTEPGTAPETAGSGFAALLWVVLVLAAIALVVWLVVRARRRKAAVGAGRASGTPGGPAGPQLSTKDLERQAGSALVATDDAIKTSEEELGFARAQFGDEATTEFEAALAAAKESLDKAFSLKQQLDDSTPDSEADTRAWNAQIVQLCTAANAALDEKAAAFDELRKLEQNAPEALAKLQELRGGMDGRVAEAESALAALGARYAPNALATIADNPAQARQRLAFADERLADAQQDIGAGKGGEAAVAIRAAEEAVDQAGLLADAVGKLSVDLEKAQGSIGELVANLQQDIATASALPDPDGRVAAAVASTKQAVDAATAASAGTQLAPLQVLQSLEGANTQIDGVIAGVRDAQAAAQRAQQQLGQQILQAQAQVSAAEDYITARRGAVGADARTRLAEAGSSLVQAQQLQATDAAQALASAQRANQLAGQAIQLAQDDVGSFDGGGMFGGSGGGNGNVLGAVLGGIVINSLLGGGGRGGGGMFGGSGGGGSIGGMFGGSGGGGSIGPGSFGGGGTRSRRGGGRF